jgi:putative glycosyltransferase (TIGR04372 family)
MRWDSRLVGTLARCRSLGGRAKRKLIRTCLAACSAGKTLLGRLGRGTGRAAGVPVRLVKAGAWAALVWALRQARVRFLTCNINNYTRIGHIVMDLDVYVKKGRLGTRPWMYGIMLAPPEKFVNFCMLSYWRRYVRMITHPKLIKFLEPLAAVESLRHELATQFWPTTFAYEAKFGTQPLLSLSKGHIEEGWKCLGKFGVPRGSWFACLHVRESGFLPHMTNHAYRDADVFTYLPAVEAIRERGGWVIRMGDPTMKKLPRMDRVIDYPYTDARSDWMDVFCLASCKFFLGTTSGPLCVSYGFGVPVAGANWTPMVLAPFSKKDLFIPKLLWSEEKERLLTFEEVLSSPLRDLTATWDYLAHRVRLVDSTPDEIKDLALEMLGRLDGTARYTPEDEQLQARFQALMALDPTNPTPARAGRDFLRKYRNLLEGGGEQDSEVEPLLCSCLEPQAGVLRDNRLRQAPFRAGLRGNGSPGTGVVVTARPDFLPHPARAHAVAFSPDGRTLATGCDDRVVRLWDPATGGERASLQGHETFILAVAFSPDGRWLASTGHGEVKLWDMEKGCLHAHLPGHSGYVYGLGFSPDGRTVATGDSDRTVRVWDLATNKEQAVLKSGHGVTAALAFSPDGKRLAVGSRLADWTQGDLRVWDLETLQEVAPFTGHHMVMASVAFSPDGRLLASGGGHGAVQLWDPDRGGLFATRFGNANPVLRVVFTPDGKVLASSSTDGSFRLWDMGTCRELTTIQAHADQVIGLAFSPDGQTLATASADKTVKLWDLAPGRAAGAA